MSTDSSLRQAAHLLKIVADQGVPMEQLQQLFDTGLLTILLKANVAEINPDEFRRVCGLEPRHLAHRVSNAVVKVDRTADLVYPNWVSRVMHPDLEADGPSRYSLPQVTLWLHESQCSVGGYIEGLELYRYLEAQGMLIECLSLHDGREIIKKGSDIFRRFFGVCTLPLWKSVAECRYGGLRIPSLRVENDEVCLVWENLLRVMGCGHPVPRLQR